MRIGVVGSMHHIEKMLQHKSELQALGHDAYVNAAVEEFVGKSPQLRAAIDRDQKHTLDLITSFWNLMEGGDALLVANHEKNGIAGYIGVSTYGELVMAKVRKQEIYLMNPIPRLQYTLEIVNLKPIVLYGDLGSIPLRKQ